jgi:PAS domain-containing protein
MFAAQQQDNLLNSTTKGICITKRNGKVLLMNDVFEEMFKIPERKIKGTKLYFSPHIPSELRFEAKSLLCEIQMANTYKKYNVIRLRRDELPIHVQVEGASLQIENEPFVWITYSFNGIYQDDVILR